VHIWFWAWLLLTAVFTVMELLDRRLFTFPWAFGTSVAAILEYLGVWLGWQWVAFLLVSSTVFVSARRLIRRGRGARWRAGMRF
jgi:membrane protein implicated in regulation of membrane protease activity